MKQIPGVESVSFSVSGLLSGDTRPGPNMFYLRGELGDEPRYAVGHNVSTEFFATMDIPILAGRSFNSTDDGYAVIVDEPFARRYFGNRSAVGAEMWFRNTPPPPGEPWFRIVGVAARANLLGLEQRDGFPIVYHHHPTEAGVNLMYTVLLRTTRPTEAVIGAMRATLRDIDPRVPLSYAGTLEEALDEMLVSRRSVMFLLSSFAGIAVLLSTLGIYAVLAHDVNQRRREIGIRSAIGATRRQIITMILRQGLRKAGVGLGIGFAGALFLTRYLDSFLFDVTPSDLRTYVAAFGLFLLVATAASCLPARGATKIDPQDVLRCG